MYVRPYGTCGIDGLSGAGYRSMTMQAFVDLCCDYLVAGEYVKLR